MKFCWERREEEGKRSNKNVGQIISQACLKEDVIDLYEQWETPETETAELRAFREEVKAYERHFSE